MISKYGFIHEINEKTMVGILEEGKITYYENYSSPISNIYRGVVIKHLKSLDGFVVDIGLEKNALLKKKDAPEDLKPSDQLLVELLRLGQGDKLHKVTAKYTLTDGYIVLSKSMVHDDKFDMFFRTKGKSLAQDEIESRRATLESEMLELDRQKNFLPSPLLIKTNQRLNNFIKTCDYPVYSLSEPKYEGTILDEKFFIEYNYELSKALKEVESRVIKFDNGLQLVFDIVEACTVIDVNTGSFGLDLSKEDLSFKANMQVLDDLARLISIKSLGKMLLIDFLRMSSRADELSLISEFKEKLKKYNVKSQIYGFTKMGLFEMIVQ